MLDCMDWILIVGFIFLAVALITEVALRKWCVGGTKGRPESPPRLKIPNDCLEDDSNFIVELQHPDGDVIRVLIPVDSDHWTWQYRWRPGRDEPFGLNLVCSGHYT